MARLTYQRVRDAYGNINISMYDLGQLVHEVKAGEIVSDADLEKLRSVADGLRRRMSDLEQLLGGAADVGGDVAEFAEFFRTVASGVVDAQRKLDLESTTYLEEIRGKGHLLPTTFRIPKVSAEIKFGFQSVAGTRLNLIFYGDSAEKTSRNEQSMRFDIVAAPLMPESRAELAAGTEEPRGFAMAPEGGPQLEGRAPARAAAVAQPAAPAVTFVLAPLRRRRLMEALSMWATGAKQTGDREAGVVHTALLARPDRVLIVEGGEDRYYLAVANPSNFKNIGVWLLALGGRPEVYPAYRYTTKPEKAEEKALRQIHPALVAMCDRQEALLAG